jgi:hypothetical protein
MKTILTISIATLVTLALSSACEKGASATADEPATAKTGTSDREASGGADTKAQKRTALTHYEAIRAALSKDAVTAVGADAAALARAGRSVSQQAKGAEQQHWAKLTDAAKNLADMPKADADAVRKAFGDVSKHLLGALSKDAALAEGLHVFECPMAQGYQKWVQPSPKLSNPYMGKSMPECGTRSSL